MEKTIVIEGIQYKIQGDIFTTPDRRYDVFRTDEGWAYVPVKIDVEENLPSFGYYLGLGYCFFFGLVILMGWIIYYFLFIYS